MEFKEVFGRPSPVHPLFSASEEALKKMRLSTTACAMWKKIRVKGLRFYADKINKFEQQSEGTAGERRQKANSIRSFLIHNGVLIQTSPLF